MLKTKQEKLCSFYSIHEHTYKQHRLKTDQIKIPNHRIFFYNMLLLAAIGNKFSFFCNFDNFLKKFHGFINLIATFVAIQGNAT